MVGARTEAAGRGIQAAPGGMSARVGRVVAAGILVAGEALEGLAEGVRGDIRRWADPAAGMEAARPARRAAIPREDMAAVATGTRVRARATAATTAAATVARAGRATATADRRTAAVTGGRLTAETMGRTAARARVRAERMPTLTEAILTQIPAPDVAATARRVIVAMPE
jgi:hypothetical protein